MRLSNIKVNSQTLIIYPILLLSLLNVGVCVRACVRACVCASVCVAVRKIIGCGGVHGGLPQTLCMYAANMPSPSGK